MPQREASSKAALFVRVFGCYGLSRIKILVSFLTTPAGYSVAYFAELFGRESCFGFLKVKKPKVLNSKSNYAQKMFYLN